MSNEEKGVSMIKLDIFDYCHNCSYFDAVTKVIYSDGKPFDTHITCANAPMCIGWLMSAC